jgi:hypothetical protein
MTAITTGTEATRAPQRISGNLLKKVVIGVSTLIVAFLLGYVPSAISSRTAEQQNAELEHKLRVAELGSHLAMASYDVETITLMQQSSQAVFSAA